MTGERESLFPTPGSTADVSLEKAGWLKAAAAYLRQMAEVEYAMANSDSPALLAALDRAIGMPDPAATLECADRLLDVAAEYVNAAAEEIENG